MIRTLITLNDQDKAWLDRRARETGQPMTALVRDAVALYRAQQSGPDSDASTVLERTRGLWRQGDGLAWQRKLRAEWPEA